MKANAHIHSLEGKMDEVEILEHVNNNEVTALYNGKVCSAIFNVFVGAYYVDDVYGVREDVNIWLDPIDMGNEDNFEMEP